MKRLSQETATSEAEIIRQAIDRDVRAFRSVRRDLGAWEKERAFIISLVQQGAASGRRTWRREELHEG